MKERVAFLIINWNSSDMLHHCLECIVKQDFAIPEIFVLDNGSDEPLPEYFYSEFLSVHFYQNEHNIGFAAGNNFLFSKVSDCNWIALINPDAFLEADWLKKMLSAATAHPEYSFFASRLVQESNHEILDGNGDTLHLSGLAWRRDHGLAVAEASIKKREVFSPCAAAALYRRDALEAADGFDEDFFCYFEDVDLGFRLRLAGHRCLLVPDAVAYHIGSATTGGRYSDFAAYHGHRNLIWTYLKNMPGNLFWLLLPVHIAMNFATVIWFLISRQNLIILRSKWDALCGAPRMWRKRRSIQRNRVASNQEIWKILDKGFLIGLR